MATIGNRFEFNLSRGKIAPAPPPKAILGRLTAGWTPEPWSGLAMKMPNSENKLD
jgi:hypothetical protein